MNSSHNSNFGGVRLGLHLGENQRGAGQNLTEQAKCHQSSIGMFIQIVGRGIINKLGGAKASSENVTKARLRDTGTHSITPASTILYTRRGAPQSHTRDSKCANQNSRPEI